MAKLHVNPETGDIGRCTAKIKCDFEDIGAEHFDNQQEAQAASEKILKAKLGGIPRNVKENELANVHNVSELAFTITESDRDENYAFLVANNSEIFENNKDILAFVKNPKDKKLREKARKEIDSKFSPEDQQSHLERIAAKNLFAKAHKMGLSIPKDLEEAFESEWNDPESVIGEKHRSEQYARISEALKNGKFAPEDVLRAYIKRNALAEDLRTRGRSNPINVSVAEGKVIEEVSERLTKPTEDDVKEAVRENSIKYVNDNYSRDLKWEKVMGKKNRTDKNRDKYYDHVEEVAKADESYRFEDRVKRSAERLSNRQFFARRYKEGYITPVAMPVEQRFEKEWVEGGEEKAKSRMKDLIQLEDDFNNGKISATRIVGGGLINPKKMAREYLDREIKETTDILETRGRSNYNTIIKMKLDNTLPREFEI